VERGTYTKGLALVVAGAAGAGVALAVAFAVGGFSSSKTTVIREYPSLGGPASATSPIQTGQLTIGEIYRDVAPGVVRITATSEVVTPSDPIFGPTVQTEKALGSGFVIDKSGNVVTNYHVVAGAKSIQVSFSNNESYKATIVGTDATTDLAVLRVNAPARALTPLKLGNSDYVQVGDETVAIGNPFGLSRTVTAGIVSALQRQIVSPNQYTIDHVIQTDAAINHGNSGGPLIDMYGRVIGVNAQIEGGQGNVGIGFAIPSNTVSTVVNQILKQGYAEHPFLGLEPEPITPLLARILRLPQGVTNGMIVAKVDPGSGAAKAGLKGGTQPITVSGETYVVGGDVIARVDGQTIDSLASLRTVIAAKEPGDTVTLVIYRSNGGSGWTGPTTVRVKLGRQPS
jgi:S1-C subfamily serine protease